MEWIKTLDRLPEERIPVLITNYGFLDRKNPRYYCVAERRGDLWQDPDTVEESTDEHFYAPDYWCEIVPPEKGE